jgi:hypothetical protein
MVMKEATWQDGTLLATMFEPFEHLLHSNHVSRKKK